MADVYIGPIQHDAQQCKCWCRGCEAALAATVSQEQAEPRCGVCGHAEHGESVCSEHIGGPGYSACRCYGAEQAASQVAVTEPGLDVVLAAIPEGWLFYSLEQDERGRWEASASKRLPHDHWEFIEGKGDSANAALADLCARLRDSRVDQGGSQVSRLQGTRESASGSEGGEA